MRSLRWRFPKVSWLLFMVILLLVLSFAAYIGFPEKYPYSQFSYFRRASEVPQVDIQQATLEPVTANGETSKLPDVILGSNSSRLEQDVVKRLGANNELYAQDAALQGSIKPTETEARNKSIISVSTKKVAEDKLRPMPNKNLVTDRRVSLTAGQNHDEAVDANLARNKKQSEKTVAPVSHSKEEKNKGTVPRHQRKKQFESIHVTQASSPKQSTATNLLPLQGRNVTLPSNANQTKKKQPRETSKTKEHSANIEPVSAIVDHKSSASTVQQTTHLIPPTLPRKRFKASDFKSEPHWDFEDQYLLDNSTLPSSCPDSLRVKAAKSDWLKDVFLPNITLFMDRSHFSASEWERMEHFPPPFGFMELNYSLVKEVITMLPPKPYHQILLAHNSSSKTSRCTTCAVVGNGGILNNSRMGKEIDSHDYVFRVSGAVIEGYEKDVGTRTSFYGFTAYSIMASLASLQNRGFKKIPMGKEIKYLHFLEGARDYEWLKALLLNVKVRKGFLDYYGPRPRDVFSNNFNLDKYFVIHPDFTRYMKNRFLRSKTLDKPYWRIYRPTTGALLLLTALHLCDQVSAYGYITEGYQKYSDHYYDKQWKRLIFYTNHDFNLEQRVWKKLHDENIMKLYQRS
ncbi:alpha-N-acetylgalactosaminide alpha-2,6-sialyltransferase 1 [Sceloporus undulatus]|uniref:alpha-N-acetylgalactosaminide alpha-2,6-sialyltransferase 1 n=1 Tax=Sceloporus undulatus TaxID=8520 RepID=UPI001C4BD1F8|nr:alpha-N-acetylgalactosaminide alpha-2,6-sialyltransferase 1 [Sceloporus undulatus]